MTTNIDPSEREDFENLLHRHNRSPDEFELMEQVKPIVGGAGIQPLQGTVTITIRRSGAKRIYATGHGSNWVADFQRDFEAGVFA